MLLASEVVQNSFNNLFDSVFLVSRDYVAVHVYDCPQVLQRSLADPGLLSRGVIWSNQISLLGSENFFHPFCPSTVVALCDYEKSRQDSRSESMPKRQKASYFSRKVPSLVEYIGPCGCMCASCIWDWIFWVFCYSLRSWAGLWHLPFPLAVCGKMMEISECHLPSFMSFTFFLLWTYWMEKILSFFLIFILSSIWKPYPTWSSPCAVVSAHLREVTLL